MDQVIITGVNGFVGEHVAREFKSYGMHVIGVGHDKSSDTKLEGVIDEYIACDLLDSDAVNERLSFSAARAVVHLAGLANQGDSFNQPQRYMTDNGLMTHNLLQKALTEEAQARFIVISTGALYDPKQELPLTEESRIQPNSPYAVGKMFAENIVNYYGTRGVDTVIIRPFNHIGPGQLSGFLVPDLYDQLKEGSQTGIVRVGNLESQRDYTDVRDIAKAYGKIALAEALPRTLYNACSGKAVSGTTILQGLMAVMGLENIKVELDPSKARPNDTPVVTGSYERLKEDFGWEPTVPLETTIADFVNAKTAA